MGLPFLTSSTYTYYITPQIYDEIKHIKKNVDGLNLLLITKKVVVIEASTQNIAKVKRMEAQTGRICLSEADKSIVALGMQLNLPILSTDFSLVNVAKHLSIQVITPGKKNFVIRSSIKYCSICKKFFTKNLDYCEYCGNRLIARSKN
jgi:endoribonuclease Nob1